MRVPAVEGGTDARGASLREVEGRGDAVCHDPLAGEICSERSCGMVVSGGMADGADEGELFHVAGEAGEVCADGDGGEVCGNSGSGSDVGLGIKGIEMAHAAFHEEMDDRFYPVWWCWEGEGGAD